MRRKLTTYCLFVSVVIIFAFLNETMFYWPSLNKVIELPDPSSLSQKAQVLQQRDATSPKRCFESTSDVLWDTKCGDRIQDQLAVTLLSSKTKVIWLENGHKYWGVPNGNGVFGNNNCLVKNCKLVDNFAEGDVDARLFTQNFMFADISLAYRQPRTYDEVWIIFILESPYATPNYEGVENIFNWTMTYRTDSTIVTPYAKWVANISNEEIIKRTTDDRRNYAARKSKKVAMFVSNCESANNRLGYARKLAEYIDVDIYGDCGDKSCPIQMKGECFKMLRKDYKFYLAFENANCREYITEKLFINALSNDILPVVMGAHPKDYQQMAPPGSYIHVDEFESPRHLASYLHKLDQNDHLYNEYFSWKSKGDFISTKYWCRLCAMLHVTPRPKIVFKDLNDWWRAEGTCLYNNQHSWTKAR